MYYTVVKLPPAYRQMTLEELLNNAFAQNTARVFAPNFTNTRTYVTDKPLSELSKHISIRALIRRLDEFNTAVDSLRSVPRHDLYREFKIPKKSGGFRKIDAPNDELKNALRVLKSIFENDFGALYHTSAFAYIKGRSTLDAVKRHQQNESKWFGKLDLSDFFGSTTLPFVIGMLRMVFPFSEVMKDSHGLEALTKALELAFLDGGLPQGTPISPLITNIMMIPVDYQLSNGFRDLNGQHYIYTRYADDFLISSRYDFDIKAAEQFVRDTLNSFEAPFTIKAEKTRYGSSAGSNWNLGVMLNKDNQITIGHKKKKEFKAMLTSYCMDRKNGIAWEKGDVQTLEGYRNYYTMVEGDVISDIVDRLGKKFGVDIMGALREDLKSTI